MTPAEMAALHAASFTTPRPWNEAEIAALLDGPGCFAALLPGGFALGRAIAGEAELLTIAVDPACRRQGLGRRLLAAFETAARDRGAERAFLEVAADNAAAEALYLGAGYGMAGRRRGYYRDPAGRPVDALVLSRDLPAAGPAGK
ncbi:GNAT family N-acetyltransferase [Mangrovicoccus algicola]|uniref:GNAT family N-acetyltransferase n=1 Tax=Mangrovicoccus algicola TaxID=2771008 RepID=A0A8J6YZ96_9RHOB|nr:GNAT family N-acetyltransferase [Mangrovicoccus algicola]MBE3639409.1 GNAT family N-acetyltransferase [Mangrovicoccus algicola]